MNGHRVVGRIFGNFIKNRKTIRVPIMLDDRPVLKSLVLNQSMAS